MSTRKATPFFLAILSIYLLTGNGYLDTIDANPSVETAYSLVERGTLLTDPVDPEPMVYREVGHGKFVSKMGWTLPWLYAPLIVYAKLLSHVLPLPERTLAEFLISFVNSFLTLGVLLLLYVHWRWSGRLTSEAVLLCVLMGFGTLLFPYAKTAHREPVQALILVAIAVFSVHQYRFRLRPFFALAVGTLVGIAFLTRIALWIPILPFALYFLWTRPSQRQRLLFIAPVVASVVVHAALATLSFGSGSATGYSPEVVSLSSSVWSTPILDGVFKQWFALDTGLIPHCPLVALILSVFVLRLVRRDVALWEALPILAIVLQTVLYARWFSPTGGPALGPRYLVVVLPLFGMLLGNLTIELLPRTRLQFLAFLIISWSLLIQTVNSSVKAQQYWSMRAIASTPLSMPHWLANLEIFFHKSEGKSEIYDPRVFGGGDASIIDLRQFETLTGVNYWWLHVPRLLPRQYAPKKAFPKPIAVRQMDKTRKRRQEEPPDT